MGSWRGGDAGMKFGVRLLKDQKPVQHPPHIRRGSGKRGPPFSFSSPARPLPLHPCCSVFILRSQGIRPWRSLRSPHTPPPPELTGDVIRDPLWERKRQTPRWRQLRFLSFVKTVISFLRPRAKASHHQTIYTFRFY